MRRRVVPEPCGSASRGVLAPTDAFTSGAPSSPRTPPCEGSRGTRVARLSSVPSSGFLPLSTVPASTRRVSRSLDPAVCRGPQRFAAFFHAARVPGASLQSFPFPRSRTRSRGPLLPCGFAFDRRQRSFLEKFTIAFAARAKLFAQSNPPEGGPGRMSRDEGSPRSLRPVASTRRARRTCRPRLERTGLAGRRPARPLRSLAPPGSPFCDEPTLGQSESARRCSPGILTLQSFLHYGSGSGLSRRYTRQGQALYLVHLRVSSRHDSLS